MYTNKHKRETRLVRVSVKWHKKLKLLAIYKNTTISKLLDEIVKYYKIDEELIAENDIRKLKNASRKGKNKRISGKNQKRNGEKSEHLNI